MTSPSSVSELSHTAATVRSMPGLVALLRSDGHAEAVSPLWEAWLGASSAAVRVGRQTLPEALRAGADSGEAHAALDGTRHALRWSSRPLPGTGWLVLMERQAAPAASAAAERYGAQLRELYRVSTTPYDTLDALLRDVLAVGCEMLGLPMGAVNTFRGATCRYRAVMPQDAVIRAGDEWPVEDTLCHYVQEAGTTVSFPDLSLAPGGRQHFAYREQHVRAYIGVPLRVGDELYGSLFFADTEPHGAFDARAVEFAELMARRIERAIEQERVSAEIQSARQLLLHAQRMARLGSWQWHAGTGRIEWSDELYRIFNLPHGSDVPFEQYISRIHPDDRPALQACIERALQQHEGYTTQHRVVWPDGQVRHVHSVAEVTTDDRGAIVLTGTAQDITERIQAEEALRESEARFRLLAENASDVISLHAPDGTYLYVSPSVRRMSGYEPEEIIGRTPYDFLHPDDAARTRAEDHAALLQGEPVVTLLRMRRKDDTYIWVETLARPICDDDGGVTHLQSSARDVTERVQAEQALARTNQALEQRNRELQDFAYVASHDLQEPLRKIRAFTDLLHQDNAAHLDEQGRHYLDRISDAAERMSRLISDLLTFSRVTTRGQPFYRVDLAEIVNEVLGNLEIALQESHGQVDVGRLPTLEADAMQMRQLFQNLIGNALKFRDPDRPPRVQIRGRVRRNGEGRVVIIEVNDNGIGFDEKYLDRIFTPFQRLHTRQQYAGTGMGLAICRRIVERHQGQITARSTPGAGTTFIVTLPCTQPSPTELPS